LGALVSHCASPSAPHARKCTSSCEPTPVLTMASVLMVPTVSVGARSVMRMPGRVRALKALWRVHDKDRSAGQYDWTAHTRT
jgi:hypothetical protein